MPGSPDNDCLPDSLALLFVLTEDREHSMVAFVNFDYFRPERELAEIEVETVKSKIENIRQKTYDHG